MGIKYFEYFCIIQDKNMFLILWLYLTTYVHLFILTLYNDALLTLVVILCQL
jgi:hypothetical protein